jgi:hypothetical protein
MRKKIYPSIHLLIAFYAKHALWFLVAAASVVFVGFYLLNYFTPMYFDDYIQSFIWAEHASGYDSVPTDRVTNLSDIFESIYNLYFAWSGRLVVFFFNYLFLLFEKSVFNLLNSLMYVAFTFLIYFHINAYRKVNVALYIAINLLIWYYNPAFGETLLWLSGACGYLWSAVFALTFLLPFRLYAANTAFTMNRLQTVLFTAFALFAACGQEHVNFCMIIALCLFFIYYRKLLNVRIPVWAISSAVAAFIGFVVLMAAPGNFIRAALTTSPANTMFYYSTENNILANIFVATKMINYYFSDLFFIALVLLVFLVNSVNSNKKEINNRWEILIYGIPALLVNYSIIMNPSFFTARTWFATVSFMFIAVGLLYVNIPVGKVKSYVTFFALLWLMNPFLLSYSEALRDARDISNRVESRTALILEQSAQGCPLITVEGIKTENMHNPRLYDDINNDKDFISNKFWVAYYGLNSSVRSH